MNRFLADTLSLISGLIAISVVIGGVFLGYRISNGSPFGLFVGGILGIVLAALSCGTLAYLALIEEHLAKIANNENGAKPEVAKQREPILTDNWSDYS